MAPEEVSAPTRKHAICRGLRHPCTRSQTEVEAQLRRFSTVPDVVNHVLGIRRTSCTRADSESVSDCGSARISESCRTSKHRLLNVFQHLRTHRHLQLLSDFVTHTSCQQGRNHHPFDKEQTLFLVQMCLAVFRLDLVRKEQCTNVCTMITPVALLSETTKRQNWFLNWTRVEKHSNCSSFWKFVCHQSSSVMLVGVVLHLQCGFQDQATVSSVLDTRLDKREAVHHCQEANTLHQLVSLWKTRN